MSETLIIGFLFVYIAVREIFFMYSTHKLVNKIMSHSFYDYQKSVQAGKPVPEKMVIKDLDEGEDFGALQGFGIL